MTPDKETWMKRLLVLAMLGVIASATLAESSNHWFFQRSGVVRAPNPASRVYAGLTETLNPCNVAHPDAGNINGLDGFWLRLPNGSVGRTALLDWGTPNDSLDAVDFDAWFYDSRCELIQPQHDENAYSLADPAEVGLEHLDAAQRTVWKKTDEGVIPQGAEWVIVNLVAGQQNTFIFTIN